MNYEESIAWLYNFKQFGSKLGLERISHLVKQLDNPHNNIKIIHVTGTNGKGSVCKFIASILQKAGYTTGIYISPHLQRFSERIVVNDEEISEEDVVSLVVKIKPIVDSMIKQHNMPTFFEIVTAMALQFFSDYNVDFAVVEVGLGGRYDATNVVSPIVTIITNISLEHSQQLGEDVKSIAFEKAGIIKDGIPIITATRNDARDVIEQIAKEKKAPITVIDGKSWIRLSHSMNDQAFLIHGFLKDHSVKTSMLGEYQGENIALAIASIEELQIKGVYLPDTCYEDGIAAAFNPGRMEIISKEPTILLDGAHNPVGMEMLKMTLLEDFDYDRLILILGILRDKDIEKMLNTIVPISDLIVVTKSSNARACDPAILKREIEKIDHKKEIVTEESLSEAIDHAKSLANKDDLICISGSLFTVGEARSYLIPSISEKIIRS
jgi:dihydrofolate synthase/folylpolyglutamate synthase